MLTEQLLDKLAHQVVDRFLTEKVALTEGVVDTARQENLNPEQIKRLVESVNNLTFLQKFNGTPTGQDRVVEFETANPNAAIQRLLEDAKTECNPSPDATKTGSCEELPFTRAGLPEALPEEKTAAAPETRSPDKSLTVLKLRKTAELLGEQKYQARIGLTETLEALATRFTRTGGVTFHTFEKDAFYKWGDTAGPYLQLLRQSLRLPTAEYDYSTMSKVARIIDSNTPEMQQLQKLMQYHRDIEQLENGQQKIADYLERLS